MSKIHIIVGILVIFFSVGLTGAAFAGEGDYPPLGDEIANSATAQVKDSPAANCGRNTTQKNISIQDCLSKCS